MHITLNGQPHQVEDGQTLQHLIEQLSLSGKAVAVAVNRQVIRAGQWELHALQANDQVDIVRAIGGG